jgi:hypothetical protein
MVAPHSEAVLEALRAALAVICWKKEDLKAFVELTPNVRDIVTTIQWKRNRREIATELVSAMTKVPGTHAEHLADIISRLCELPDSFIEHKNVDRDARRAAKKAVSALRDAAGLNCKTSVPPSDTHGRARDRAIAVAPPENASGEPPAVPHKESADGNDVPSYLPPARLFALVCSLLALPLVLAGTRKLTLAWLLLSIASIAWYLAPGWRALARVLGRMSRHWFPMTLFGAVCLMAGGRIGAYLGIPQLFHDDSVLGFGWNSPAFWGAFGAAILLGEIWIIVYLVEYTTNYTRLDPITKTEGDPMKRTRGWDPLGSWPDLSQDLSRFNDPRPLFQFLLANMPPFLVLYVLSAASAGQAGGENARPVWIEVLVYMGGVALGVVILAPLVLVGFELMWLARVNKAVLGALTVPRCVLHVDDSVTPQGPDDPRRAVTMAFLAFLLVLLLAAAGTLNLPLIVPSLAISVLFGLILTFYFVLVSLKRSVQLVFLVLVVAYISWSNGSTYKSRFPNMTDDNNQSLYEGANLLPARSTEAAGPGPDDPLLDNISVLRRWKRNLKDEKPKVVLISVTGGAYRSGFWAAAVLDDLRRRSQQGSDLPGLTDRVRIITGASGGMVGAAYFVALREDKQLSVVEELKKDSKRDSLTPVIQQMVQGDIPMVFWPVRHQPTDRGVKLEEQWKTIARPFHDTYEAERQGRCPSLILSPMVVETGERMLISHLDLEDITSPVSKTGELYTESARQFYRMFPTTQRQFGLNTAVRMSASFPYISPAVSLPTSPVLRLVDAGYYDNYGVNLAAAWAYEYRDWILSETSGLALIQIYAFPRADASESAPVPATSREMVGVNLERGFSWFTSPIEGALGARDWSMLYRNEEQLRLLDDTFNQTEASPRMFESFVFTYSGGAAMNWTIADRDIEDMVKSISAGNGAEKANAIETFNNRQMAKLIAWWNSKPYERRLERPISTPGRLHSALFEKADALTPYVERRVNTTLDRFRAYFGRLGCRLKNDPIKIEFSKDQDMVNAYYEPERNSITIGPRLAKDNDSVLHEYVHHVIEEELKGKDEIGFNGFRYGLASYFTCSFKGDPELGVDIVALQRKLGQVGQDSKPYLYTMDNHEKFKETYRFFEQHEEGTVWGGAFWELREVMGRDEQHNRRADVLILRTVQNLRHLRIGDGARAAIVSQILAQDKQLHGGKHAAKIREVFAARGVEIAP